MPKMERISIPVRDVQGVLREPELVDGIRVGPLVVRPLIGVDADGVKRQSIAKGGRPMWTVSSPTGYAAGNFAGQRRALAAARALLEVKCCDWETSDPAKTFPSEEAKRAAYDAIRELRL